VGELHILQCWFSPDWNGLECSGEVGFSLTGMDGLEEDSFKLKVMDSRSNTSPFSPSSSSSDRFRIVCLC
jgi:hypothetical protein